MMQIDYPFHFDNGGRTASCASSDDHIRNMIEQILFTDPGERVNRPDFGCGVRRLIFLPNNDVQAAAAQFLIQGALQQQMGDRIEVEAVDVQADDASLNILVQYSVKRTQQRKIDKFVHGANKP
jgi:phage baseplate assembly protein W